MTLGPAAEVPALNEDHENDQKSSPELDEEEQYEIDKRALRSFLFGLYQIDDIGWNSNEQISAYLEGAVDTFSSLQELYPDDPDLMLLGELLNDMVSDFLRGEDIEDFEAYDVIMGKLQNMIGDSSVYRVEDLEDLGTHPRVKSVVDRLRAMDVEPQIVLSGKENAPVLVLYLQLHHVRGDDPTVFDPVGTTSSQAEIRRIVETGLCEAMFTEGIQFGSRLLAERIPSTDHYYGLGIVRAVQEHPDLFNIEGYEDRNSDPKHSAYGYRDSALNAFLGSNIAELAHRYPDQVSGAAIGLAHEVGIDDRALLLGEGRFESVDHPLPISEVIAYYGVDVVIVDAATPFFDVKALQKQQADAQNMSVRRMKRLLRRGND